MFDLTIIGGTKVASVLWICKIDDLEICENDLWNPCLIAFIGHILGEFPWIENTDNNGPNRTEFLINVALIRNRRNLQRREGKLKGMLIVGENPASSFPASSLIRDALASLEFLVAVDMFLT